MRPFFFGDGPRQLFGAYHAASEGRARGLGVVIAYPCMYEYNMSHWALRKLASMLARAGFPTLRFDYYGTGDSAGESDAATPAEWVDNIASAARELRDQSGVRDTCIVGLRLGASLAALALERGLSARQLVMWNPVVSGREYVRELEQLDTRQRLLRLYPEQREGELLGYPLAPGLRRGLDGVDLGAVRLAPGQRVHLVMDRERTDYAGLIEAWRVRGVRVSWTVASEGRGSANAAEGEAALLSSKPLQAITDLLLAEEGA